MMKRIVVTGIGTVTPFGLGVELLWQSLLNNKNGITKITDNNIQGDVVGIAGILPKVDFTAYQNKLPFILCRIPEDDSIKTFFVAANEAITHSGLDFLNYSKTNRVASFVADRSLSRILYIDQYAPLIKKCINEQGIFSERDFYQLIEQQNIDKNAFYNDCESFNHYLSRVYNITGPQLSISTACASSNSTIGEAFLKIQHGFIDVAIAGGAYNFDLNAMIGFTRIGALTQNPDPETACCPFDRRRSGFVMGSGCGILILEELEHAKRRNANILCEIKGYGYYSDSFRSTDPDPEALGITRTINACLEMAKLRPEDISYINAHGTSTQMNDKYETVGIKNVFKEFSYQIPISSTKSMIGHPIMAAGAIEAIVCIKSLQENVIHPTHNWKERDSELDLDYVPEFPREKKINNVLSNNFGFGGQNASIIYSKFNNHEN
ncbi:MAG: beta-ketoacyl-[acyl-carrier-protein] synthase family protein [Bacteroidales bacterium]|nr:beta-ketoacyl-[acyl-carrier-protein] synthase family protein [Bacteroidales bacterium]